jgi:hypothetical protein
MSVKHRVVQYYFITLQLCARWVSQEHERSFRFELFAITLLLLCCDSRCLERDLFDINTARLLNSIRVWVGTFENVNCFQSSLMSLANCMHLPHAAPITFTINLFTAHCIWWINYFICHFQFLLHSLKKKREKEHETDCKFFSRVQIEIHRGIFLT